MSVLTEAKVTTFFFLNCLFISEPFKIYALHCPSGLLSSRVNMFPHTYTSPLLCLFFACFSLKMKQNKCSAAKTLTQNSPAPLGSGELPDLSANTPFAHLRGLAIFVSQSGRLFIVVVSCSSPWFSFSG